MNEVKSSKSGALLVGLGIFLSRIAGFVRQRFFAHYLGNSEAADAFNAAYKIPNFLQNLFGEGVLSASFIPVYAKLLAENQPDQKNKLEASQIAYTIFCFLFLLTSILVVIGVLLTPWLIDVIAPGFSGEKKELTIKIVRLIFPGTGLLVLSAWCLGILNSHRKFFLSYTAPVIWNFTSIIFLIYFGPKSSEADLAILLSYGLILGSLLQFLIQVPSTLKLIPVFTTQLNLHSIHFKTILKNFFPVVISRGVVQLSAYIDSILASLLPTGAVSAISYAQMIYLLPVSLFGMSISAAELPEMSSIIGNDREVMMRLKLRLESGLEKISFFIIPSIIAFIFIGNHIISLLFQSGKFNLQTTQYVWVILIGSSIGLLPTTFGRLYASTFYALKDTRTPLKFAFIRVLFTSFFGYVFAFPLLKYLNISDHFGAAGITFASALAATLEYRFLKNALDNLIGQTSIKKSKFIKTLLIALASGLIAFFIQTLLIQSFLNSLIVITIFSMCYFFLAIFFKIDEAKIFMDKIIKKVRK